MDPGFNQRQDKAGIHQANQNTARGRVEPFGRKAGPLFSLASHTIWTENGESSASLSCNTALGPLDEGQELTLSYCPKPNVKSSMGQIRPFYTLSGYLGRQRQGEVCGIYNVCISIPLSFLRLSLVSGTCPRVSLPIVLSHPLYGIVYLDEPDVHPDNPIAAGPSSAALDLTYREAACPVAVWSSQSTRLQQHTVFETAPRQCLFLSPASVP